jgi:hypothetical protein
MPRLISHIVREAAGVSALALSSLKGVAIAGRSGFAHLVAATSATQIMRKAATVATVAVSRLEFEANTCRATATTTTTAAVVATTVASVTESARVSTIALASFESIANALLLAIRREVCEGSTITTMAESATSSAIALTLLKGEALLLGSALLLEVHRRRCTPVSSTHATTHVVRKSAAVTTVALPLLESKADIIGSAWSSVHSSTATGIGDFVRESA